MSPGPITSEVYHHSFRWVVDIETDVGALPPQRIAQLRALLPPEEQAQVMAFLQPADQHRALVSRLLQRCCVSLALGVDWTAVSLSRTKGRKPFTTNPKPPAAPNFNFNVSHEVGTSLAEWNLLCKPAA